MSLRGTPGWGIMPREKTVKVLVAVGDSGARRTIVRVLDGWGFDVVEAATGPEAWGVLGGPEPPRLALCDADLPVWDGPDLCRRLRERASGNPPYVVMLHSPGAELVAGGEPLGPPDDELRHPVDLGELRSRVRAARRILGLEDALRDAALRDESTGVWSERALREVLEKALARAHRDGAPLAVVVARPDPPAAGTPVCRRDLERCCIGRLRAGDLLGRFGEDGLLLVLPCADAADGLEVARRLGRCFADAAAGDQGRTLSAGVADWVPPDAPDAAALLGLAVFALERARAAGGGQVERAVRSGPPVF